MPILYLILFLFANNNVTNCHYLNKSIVFFYLPKYLVIVYCTNSHIYKDKVKIMIDPKEIRTMNH